MTKSSTKLERQLKAMLADNAPLLPYLATGAFVGVVLALLLIAMHLSHSESFVAQIRAGQWDVLANRLLIPLLLTIGLGASLGLGAWLVFQIDFQNRVLRLRRRRGMPATVFPRELQSEDERIADTPRPFKERLHQFGKYSASDAKAGNEGIATPFHSKQKLWVCDDLELIETRPRPTGFFFRLLLRIRRLVNPANGSSKKQNGS